MNQDHADILRGYNGFKQRTIALNAIKIGKAKNKRVQLVKRLVNKGYDLQMMGIRCLKEFLRDCKDHDLTRKDKEEIKSRAIEKV